MSEKEEEESRKIGRRGTPKPKDEKDTTGSAISHGHRGEEDDDDDEVDAAGELLRVLTRNPATNKRAVAPYNCGESNENWPLVQSE